MRTAGARGTVGSVRAREPDRSGFAVRDGVRLYYEVHGAGPETVVLLPAWSIVHRGPGSSRCPTWPGTPGGGLRPAGQRSLRPSGRAVGVRRRGAGRGRAGGARRGRRREGGRRRALAGRPDPAAAGRRPSGPGGRCGLRRRRGRAGRRRDPVEAAFEGRGRSTPAGTGGTRTTGAPTSGGSPSSSSARCSRRATRRGRSTSGRVDAGDRRGDARGHPVPGPARVRGAEARAAAERVTCPALVVHGDDDRIAPLADGRALAAALGAPLEVVVGGGHCVQARHPVWFNLRLRRFVEEVSSRASA